ncbi:ferric-dicitrate binding protein FerR, regulates iron transport through sigma-19 [Catalinimonas alkaloidigena]|uniref:Ferric-dicitrate binding protein FerR, regulates iron transport through sigma-19 n=1 Tax=Catalinimonas alkaloidigena TaxID=1075417 RepID=A0A1G9SVG9_9BACT|nr:FecR domain-containing protein [Catalinimonas alkaloidigena]SDM39469.1 ferric-dicitrate binding protein FerR, regulates iron transport through sigma-19 [Catalinimonas alkaloidigena]
MLDDSHMWTLIARALAGEASADELRRLDAWRSQHPDNQHLYETVRDVWTHPPSSSAGTGAAQRVWERTQARMEAAERQKKVVSMPWWRMAAAVALVGTLGLAAYQYGWRSAEAISRVAQTEQLAATLPHEAPQFEAAAVPVTYQQAQNPKGVHTELQLADGTKVWLNADSRLAYPTTFADDRRDVYLIGEGFFEVAPDKQRPFTVHLETGEVTVLGTSFNVRAYQDETEVTTTVAEGKVAFSPEPEADKNEPLGENPATRRTLLTPHQRAVYSKKSAEVRKETSVADLDYAWVNRKLVFEETPFDQVARTLERWYGVRVHLETPQLRNCRLTGTFEKKELREIMHLISLTRDVDYKFTPQGLLITGSGC